MKKIICSFVFVFAFSLFGLSQITLRTEAKLAKANEELKTGLTTTASISGESADKIIAIEAEFFKNIAEIDAQKNLVTKDREKKLHVAHVTRRAKLMEIPLTGRQMEDVVFLSESTRRKYKL
jgi:hypothetical protein